MTEGCHFDFSKAQFEVNQGNLDKRESILYQQAPGTGAFINDVTQLKGRGICDYVT